MEPVVATCFFIGPQNWLVNRVSETTERVSERGSQQFFGKVLPNESGRLNVQLLPRLGVVQVDAVSGAVGGLIEVDPFFFPGFPFTKAMFDLCR